MIGSLAVAHKLRELGSTILLGKFQRRRVADNSQVEVATPGVIQQVTRDGVETRLAGYTQTLTQLLRKGAPAIKYLLRIARRYQPGLKLCRKHLHSTRPQRHLGRVASAHWRQRERENRLSVAFVFSYLTLGVEKYEVQLPKQAE